MENPCPGEPKFLRKRKHPKALRFYKPDQENNPVRYFLQELMLYTSFDEKTYDDWHDDELCIKAYLEKEEEIKANKRQVMEWLEDVEDGRHYVEEVLKNEINAEDIGDELDAEKEQDNADCDDERNEMDPFYDHFDLGNHKEHEFTSHSTWCKKIELKNTDQLMEETQNLDKYQKKNIGYLLSICKRYS